MVSSRRVMNLAFAWALSLRSCKDSKLTSLVQIETHFYLFVAHRFVDVTEVWSEHVLSKFPEQINPLCFNCS
jgi:hypothetical protein